MGDPIKGIDQTHGVDILLRAEQRERPALRVDEHVIMLRACHTTPCPASRTPIGPIPQSHLGRSCSRSSLTMVKLALPGTRYTIIKSQARGFIPVVLVGQERAAAAVYTNLPRVFDSMYWYDTPAFPSSPGCFVWSMVQLLLIIKQ